MQMINKNKMHIKKQFIALTKILIGKQLKQIYQDVLDGKYD